MEQNQTANNQVLDQNTDNDLQKAIDDITNTTNVDPVFSDPVAAPSSIPEGDTGELGEPIGPFPEPKIETSAPAPGPVTPINPVNNNPDVGTSSPTPMPEIASTSEPAPAVSSFPTLDPAPKPNINLPPTPELPPAPEPTSKPIVQEPNPTQTPRPTENLNTRQVKEAALRDLIPLLNKVDMDKVQLFNTYRNIFEELKDYTVLEPAYQAAREIPNEKERAEALLYLIESIDHM